MITNLPTGLLKRVYKAMKLLWTILFLVRNLPLIVPYASHHLKKHACLCLAPTFSLGQNHAVTTSSSFAVTTSGAMFNSHQPVWSVGRFPWWEDSSGGRTCAASMRVCAAIKVRWKLMTSRPPAPMCAFHHSCWDNNFTPCQCEQPQIYAWVPDFGSPRLFISNDHSMMIFCVHFHGQFPARWMGGDRVSGPGPTERRLRWAGLSIQVVQTIQLGQDSPLPATGRSG